MFHFFQTVLKHVVPHFSSWLVCLVIPLVLSGCYTVDLYQDTGSLQDQVDAELTVASTAFALLELDPPVPLAPICPGGISRLRVQQTIPNGIFHYVTLGFYSPQTLQIWCKRKKYEF